MPGADVIKLDLRTRMGAAPAQPLHAVIDESLVLLRDCLTGDDGPGRAELRGMIEACRSTYAEDGNVDRLHAQATRCFEACRAIMGQAQAPQSEKQRELASLIEVIREAMTAIAGDQSTLSGSLTLSTARFEALARITNLQELKAQLVTEVQVLKQISIERQKASDATLARLVDRVAVLESQLVTSEHEATTDPLTAVANRRDFDRACREWTKSGRAFVMAILDLDHFKAINDTHGHTVGDQALIAVARALEASVRSTDLVARYGGDEFVLLTAGLTLPQVETRMRSVIANLAKTGLLLPNGEKVAFTVSCGVAECSAGDTARSLIVRADEALYDAKRLGRNRVVGKARPFSGDLTALARQRQRGTTAGPR